MCQGYGNTQQISGYGQITKPDAGGHITPTQRVSAEEEARRIAEAQGKPGRTVTSGGDTEVTQEISAEDDVRADIAKRNAQADRDLAFLRANPAYAAKNELKAAEAPGRRGVANASAGGGGPSSLITGGTASNALAARKPRAAQPTLLGG